MIKRLVKMSFQPDKIEDFKILFAQNRNYIQNFDGCKHVELLQDANNPCIFFTYILWENEAFLDTYRQSELFARVWAATKILFNDKPQAWTVNLIQF